MDYGLILGGFISPHYKLQNEMTLKPDFCSTSMLRRNIGWRFLQHFRLLRRQHLSEDLLP